MCFIAKYGINLSLWDKETILNEDSTEVLAATPLVLGVTYEQNTGVSFQDFGWPEIKQIEVDRLYRALVPEDAAIPLPPLAHRTEQDVLTFIHQDTDTDWVEIAGKVNDFKLSPTEYALMCHLARLQPDAPIAAAMMCNIHLVKVLVLSTIRKLSPDSSQNNADRRKVIIDTYKQEILPTWLREHLERLSHQLQERIHYLKETHWLQRKLDYHALFLQICEIDGTFILGKDFNKPTHARIVREVGFTPKWVLQVLWQIGKLQEPTDFSAFSVTAANKAYLEVLDKTLVRSQGEFRLASGSDVIEEETLLLQCPELTKNELSLLRTNGIVKPITVSVAMGNTTNAKLSSRFILKPDLLLVAAYMQDRQKALNIPLRQFINPWLASDIKKVVRDKEAVQELLNSPEWERLSALIDNPEDYDLLNPTLE